MVDLYSIFKSITPENIQDIPLVQFCMQTFTEMLEKDTQVAQNISRIYDDYSDDDTTLTKEAKDNLKTGLYMLYVNTLYNACYKMQQDPEILKTLKKFNYTESMITEDLNTLINSEFLGAQRQFSQTVGTENALHYMYSFAKYLETGYVRDDLEISGRDPFIIHYEGSLNKRTFETVVYPQAHPLGWAYSYTSVITQALRDYYGIQMIYYVKKLWLINYAEGKYVIFTDKTQEEIYEEFRNTINPKTNQYFTNEEIAKQVTIYTGRKVTDYQRWEDENGNYSQLFTFDDDMVLYHDGSKHITYYTSYEDYIDGCKEPQNVWDSNFKVSADIAQDIKFEYYDEKQLAKTFNITRVRDEDHKVGDSSYMQDDMSRAFSVKGSKYTFNQGVDESRHILTKDTDLKPVGGYFLPKSETIEDRLRDLEILSLRIHEQEVEFNGKTYEVVAYDDELYVPEISKPFDERLRDIEKQLLPLKFVYTTRTSSIELLAFSGSPNTDITDTLERIVQLENKINGITEVKVTYDGGDYNLLRRLNLEANNYTVEFENDYEGRLRIFAGGFLEEEEHVKDIDKYDFNTTEYRGNRIRFECTDMLDQVQYTEVNTMNRNCMIYIEKCELCTYGEMTDVKGNIVNDRKTEKFGMTIKGKLKVNNNDEAFIFDHEVFDQVTFANNIDTVHLILEDKDGSQLVADVRTDHIGSFEYTFDTTKLQKTFHEFTLYAEYYVGNKVYDSCYYKGNWLNDFDKTPVYIKVPEFNALVSYSKSYSLKGITTNQMKGIENELVDISGMDEDERSKLLEYRISTKEVIKTDGDDITIIPIDYYRDYDFIGEKTDGYYKPDEWSSNYLNPDYTEGTNLYLEYPGFMTGSIIEGEDYYKSSWEYYPEEEVFIGLGYRKHLIDTSDFYIMTSTRFVHDDFEISSVGDDYYLFGTDDSYFYTKDEQYLVTDEDDKLPDAWGIHTEDGMNREEYRILYEHNGVILRDFTHYENNLISDRNWLDAYNGSADEKDSVTISFRAIPGEIVEFKCIGDGQFEDDPHDPVTVYTELREEALSDGSIVMMPEQTFEVDRSYVSHVTKETPSDGLITLKLNSREPFTQGPIVKAFVTREVTIKETIDTGVRDENGKVYREVEHTENKLFTHTCNIMYNVTDYTPKIELPRYITKDGYTLRFTNLLPNASVYIKEPQIIIGKADENGVFDAVFKPKTYADYENVIHTIKYYYRGTQMQEYSFILTYVDIRHSLDSEILHAWDPEYMHANIPGYTFLRIEGCQAYELIKFKAEGCLLDHPDKCDGNGKMVVKIIAKDPYDDPKITFTTVNYDITKEVYLSYAETECEPELVLPTLTNIYGTFSNTIDTDTPFEIKVNGLIAGTVLKLQANDVYQQKECTNNDIFSLRGVDYNTKTVEVSVTYRKSGREYATITGIVNVYQYIMEHGALGTMDAYGVDYFHYFRKNIVISGGKPKYLAEIEGYSTSKLGTFDNDGNLVVEVEAKPDFTEKPWIKVKSQGQELNFEIPYQLTEYVPTVNIGHIYPDVAYAPKLLNAPKFDGINNCIDYNTSYALNFSGFKPNSKITWNDNTYYADGLGNAIITIPKVTKYSTKNVSMELVYLCDNTNTDIMRLNFSLYQWGMTVGDVTIGNKDHDVTVHGRPNEAFRVQADGDVIVVRKDSSFNNSGEALVRIRGKDPFNGGTLTFSMFDTEDDQKCMCHVFFDLPLSITATEQSDRFMLKIKGTANRKLTIEVDGGSIISADSSFNSNGNATAYITKEACKVVAYDDAGNVGSLEIVKQIGYHEFSLTFAGMSGRPAVKDISGYHFDSAPHHVRQPDDYRFSHGSDQHGGALYDWGEFGVSFTKDKITVTFPRDYTYCWYGPEVIGGNVLLGWTFKQG